MSSKMKGTLYLVATPIGNLSDISFRAIETLKEAEIIACEDTRQTKKLLSHYGIASKKLISYHEHNEKQRAEQLAKYLLEGKSVALVSDAGTPAISDPGYRIIQKAHEIGARVVSIPGPVAFVSALVASGLPTDAIFFGGFLPSKRSERITYLEEVKSLPATICFYEAPNRLREALKDCLEVFGNRDAAVVRELSKIHEEILRASLQELLEKLPEKIKGEIVLIIDRQRTEKPQPSAQELFEAVTTFEKMGLDRKTAIKETAKKFGLAKSEVYRTFQQIKSDADKQSK